MEWEKEQKKMAKAKEILDEMERLSFDKSISDGERKARGDRLNEHIEELQALRNSSFQDSNHSDSSLADLVITSDVDRYKALEQELLETKKEMDILWKKQTDNERELMRIKNFIGY